MVRYLALTAALGAMILGTASAQTSGDLSANSLLPDCRQALRQSDYYPTAGGTCVGVVWATMFWRSPLRFCPPSNASMGQALRVAVLYMEQNPGRLNEELPNLVRDAFAATWPCQ